MKLEDQLVEYGRVLEEAGASASASAAGGVSGASQRSPRVPLLAAASVIVVIGLAAAGLALLGGSDDTRVVADGPAESVVTTVAPTTIDSPATSVAATTTVEPGRPTAIPSREQARAVVVNAATVGHASQGVVAANAYLCDWARANEVVMVSLGQGSYVGPAWFTVVQLADGGGWAVQAWNEAGDQLLAERTLTDDPTAQLAAVALTTS